MWQITIAELERESFQPTRRPIHFGSWSFSCPICGEVVGIYHSPELDSQTNGMILKRDECKNGHRVDWSIFEEAHE